MVLLLAGVVSRLGRPVLSREFVPMTKSRVESLLQSFPRLVSPSSEHTMLEANGVRYVYAPLEDLYIIVVTSLQSNILLDLQALQLISRIVIEFSSNGHGGAVPITEYDVQRVAFDITFAWDECVSLGYLEGVTLPQVRTILEMDSHEEHIQEIIDQNKEMEAREELKRRAKQMEMQKRESRLRGYDYDPSVNSPTTPVISTGAAYNSVPTRDNLQTAKAAPLKAKGLQLSKGGKRTDGTLREALAGLGATEPESRYDYATQGQAAVPESVPIPAEVSQQAPVQAAPVAAAPVIPAAPAAVSAPAPPVAPAASSVNPFATASPQPVYFNLSEKLSVERTRDGSISAVRVRGLLELKISDPTYSNIVGQLNVPAPGALGSNEIQFKTHPNVDKDAWTQNAQLRVKQGRSGFPGNSSILPLLRWSLTGRDETIIPISVDCWPLEESPDGNSFSIEYDLLNPTMSLANVRVLVPMRGIQPLSVDDTTQGTVEFLGDYLVWSIGQVDESQSNGSFSFTIQAPYDAIFPISVDFQSPSLVCGVSMDSVSLVNSPQTPVPVTVDNYLAATEFSIS